MSFVFISYSHQDSSYAHRLPQEFQKKGFEIWLDENLNYGDEWFRKITQAIKDCAAFVLIMTPEAEASRWVHKEILIAMEYSKPILPLLLRGNVFSVVIDIHYYKLDKTWDFLPSPAFYQALAKEDKSRKSIISQDDLEKIRKEKVARSEQETNPQVYKDILYWGGLARSDNYYSILRYAIALSCDENSQHDAMRQLKRAFILEPRILNRTWLASQYEWNDTYETLLQKLVDEPEFHNLRKSHGF